MSAVDPLRDKQWVGEPAFIIGGGPSLKRFDWGALAGRHTIGINMAFLHTPEVALLLDYRLLDSLEEPTLEGLAWQKFTGYKLWLAYEQERRWLPRALQGVQKVRWSDKWTETMAEGLHRGTNAGTAALHLGYLLGASPLYLLGFDGVGRGGRTANWHEYYGAHGWPVSEVVYDRFGADFARIAPCMKYTKVVNLNPATAYRAWPTAPAESVLGPCWHPSPIPEESAVAVDEPALPPPSKRNFDKYFKVSDPTPGEIKQCPTCHKPTSDGALAYAHRACALELKLQCCFIGDDIKQARAFTDAEARQIAQSACLPAKVALPAAEPRLHRPWGHGQTLTVVVGCCRKDLLPAKVLESTVRRHATVPLGFVFSMDLEMVQPADHELRARTGFSYARIQAPRWASTSRAVYFDSDMLVFRDVRELAELQFRPGAHVARPANMSAVMVYDCAQLQDWDAQALVDGGRSYREIVGVNFMDPTRMDVGGVPLRWNMLDQWSPEAALLHFTNIPTQPWTYPDHKLGYLWDEALYWAVERGEIAPAMVADEVARGHVKQHVLDRLTLKLSAVQR